MTIVPSAQRDISGNPVTSITKPTLPILAEPNEHHHGASAIVFSCQTVVRTLTS